ncbi:hypothetical protein HYW94_03250 [Candidatus Uhrbacteria bacterium]|nr:hypothetical protein [Candidatus Uhrbacteria bacterium]
MIETLAKTGKKALTISVVGTTIAWATGVAAFVPMLAGAATLTDGDLIKASGPAVYYYRGTDGKRCPFPNDKVFYSWFSDFKSVKTLTDAELAAVGLCSTPMTYRSGTRLVKIQTDPKVYAIELPNTLRHVADEATAKALFGDNWNKQIDDVADVFFGNYSASDKQVTTAAPPAGFVFKASDTAKLYYIDKDSAGAYSKREVSDLNAFKANGWKEKDIRSVAPTVLAGMTAGSAIAAAEKAISTPQWAAAPVAGEKPAVPALPAGALTVAMAANNPAAAVHASGSSYNGALALTFSAAGGPVEVKGVTVTRGGLAVDANISGVAAFENGNRLSNFVTFANAKATLPFTTALSIPSGSSKTLWVKTNVAAGNLTGTYNMSVIAATDVNTASTVSGTFPMQGNTFSLTNGANVIGTLTIDAVLVHNNGANDVTAVNINLGTLGQEIGRFRFVAGANEDVKLSKITMYNNGNTSDGDVKNISLYAPDGTLLAKVDKTTDRYATFDMSAKPYVILKGTTRDLSLRLDVVGGSSRTARFVINNDYDIEASGTQTGSGILTTAAGAVDTAFPMGDSNGAASCSAGNNCLNKITVNSGTLLWSKAGDSKSGNISAGANNIELGKWIATPQGEDMEVRTMVFTVTYGTALTGTLKIKVGDTIVYTLAGSSVAATGANNTANLSTYPVLKAGVPTSVTILGDLSSSVTSGSTYLVNLDITQVKRLSTNDLIDPSVNGTNANTLTVAAASLQVAKNASYPDTTIVAGLSPAKVGSFNLVAGSTEDVNVTSMSVGLNGVLTNASSLILKSGDTQLNQSALVPAAANTISTTGFTVPKGGSKTVDVYVNSNSATTGPTSVTITAISGTGASSGAAVTATGVVATGQTITWVSNGTLTLALDTTNTSTAQVAHSNLVDIPVLAARMTTNNAEDIRIANLQVSVSNGMTNWKDIKLFDGATQVGSTTQLVNGVALFGGLTYVVPKDSTKTLTVKASTNSSGTLNSQSMSHFAIDYLDAFGVSGGTTIKPGSTLYTTWTLSNTVITSGAISVGSTIGFHAGDVIFVHSDDASGGSLGLVLAEPTTTTSLTVATQSALTLGANATVSKLASGATTAASAGNLVIAGQATTVTSTKGFNVGDAVLVSNGTVVTLGYVSAVGSGTSMTINALAANGNAASRVSKLGTDTLSTAASAQAGAGVAAGTVLAPTATTVTSTTGFNVGDMVLQWNSVIAGSFGLVTAIGSTTAMTIASNAAQDWNTDNDVAGVFEGNSTIVRVGSANPTTALVSSAASAGNRAIAGTAHTVSSTVGFAVGDIVLSTADTLGSTLGVVSVVGNATSLTVNSASALGSAATRVVRLPGAAAAGNFVTIHDTEPVITLNTGFAGGNSSGGSGQIVGMYDIKADGDRNMTVSSLDVKAGGSNLPWQFVTSYDLYNGSTRLASATPLNATVTGAGAAALTASPFKLCSGVAAAAGEIDVGAAADVTAAAAKIAAGDTIVVMLSTTNYITAIVTAKTVTGNCTNADAADVTLAITNISLTGAAITTTTATAVKSFNVIFDASSATPLAPQTITAGSALTLTVKADTTSVKSGVTSGNVNYNTSIALTETYTGARLSGGLTWGYTPTNGTAITGLTASDSYPVNAPALVY